MSSQNNPGGFKRYNKVLGTKVERILRVRNRPKNLRKQVEVMALPDEEFPTPPAAKTPPPPLTKRVDIVRTTRRMTSARRIISKQTGILISHYDDRVEIALPNPSSSAHCTELAHSLEKECIGRSTAQHWSIDLRAMKLIPGAILEALSTVSTSLRQNNKTLSLIVDEEKQLYGSALGKIGPAAAQDAKFAERDLLIM
ncbi:MAG: hypothetical protein J5J00_02380 [Deltaproteobacteria bacterium]|nr:hypothetical protein [Deltaproteobacteria bacterium]